MQQLTMIKIPTMMIEKSIVFDGLYRLLFCWFAASAIRSASTIDCTGFSTIEFVVDMTLPSIDKHFISVEFICKQNSSLQRVVGEFTQRFDNLFSC
jgi:hypothetical protein